MRLRAGLLALICSIAVAYELEEVPLDEKVKRASLVVIGVVQNAPAHSSNFQQEFAQVKVETVLKGSAPISIQVQTYGSHAESAFVVMAGRRYLFFLRLHKGTYYSVNGRFGVIPVDGKPRVPN